MSEQLKRRMVIFTDLDGTLIDHSTYSFGAAKPALQKLRKRNIPVVICTSKTRAEVEVYRKALNNADPFIVESGGAIFVPLAYFLSISSDATRRDDYWMIALGAEYGQLLEGLGALKAMTRNDVKGFSDMSAEEVAKIAGLSLEQAGRSSASLMSPWCLFLQIPTWKRSCPRSRSLSACVARREAGSAISPATVTRARRWSSYRSGTGGTSATY
jgi:mannosyl-3-phosphoglycerate phosphatase family protein